MSSPDENDDSVTILPVVVSPPTDEDLRPGARAGSYVIGEKIGRGGCGTVYLATRDGDSRPAAVKVLHRFLAGDAHAVERFLREVQAVNRIKHPSIVEIYELGRMPDERPYFAMELLQGSNLRRLLQREGRLSPLETYEIVEQVCGALEAAHAVGVVHRDVKPENVIVGDDRNVKLVDFGVAKLLEPDPASPGLTTTQQMLGTLAAMAPEQIRCLKIDARTDVYGMGTLIYNLLTGVYPFRGAPEELARMHLEVPPRPPSTLALLPPAIDAVVLRCLEKDPQARYPGAAALLAALREAVFGDQAPKHARTGIGVLVRATAADGDDEDALAEAALALDDAEAQLRAAGYAIALQTSTEVLGVAIAPATPAQEHAQRRAAIALANQLFAAIRGQGPALRAALTVHVDEVHVREASGEIVGGPMLEIGAWSRPDDGVSITSRARAGLVL